MKSRNRSDRVQTQVHEPILRQLPAWFAGVWLSAACVRKFCLYEHSAFTKGEELPKTSGVAPPVVLRPFGHRPQR